MCRHRRPRASDDSCRPLRLLVGNQPVAAPARPGVDDQATWSSRDLPRVQKGGRPRIGEDAVVAMDAALHADLVSHQELTAAVLAETYWSHRPDLSAPPRGSPRQSRAQLWW